jgi:predicted component of type VI protein secretion system
MPDTFRMLGVQHIESVAVEIEIDQMQDTKPRHTVTRVLILKSIFVFDKKLSDSVPLCPSSLQLAHRAPDL